MCLHPLFYLFDVLGQKLPTFRAAAAVEMTRRLIMGTAVWAACIGFLIPSAQHFACTTVPGALFTIPELVHTGPGLQCPLYVKPCHCVENLRGHYVLIFVKASSGSAANVEAQPLSRVSCLLLTVNTQSGTF